MTYLIAAFLLSFFNPASAAGCNGQETDLLIIGDSQTGATWGRHYYGNFLQQCLRDRGLNFRIYGRGATQPIHWLTNARLDMIETIMRDPDQNQVNLGKGEVVPECQKRLPQMLKTHGPKKFIAFFGDNLLGQSKAVIASQFSQMVKVVSDFGIGRENCYILTPTFEMEVTSKRNVPGKNLKVTQEISAVAVEAIEGKCQHLSGLDLMINSSLLKGEFLSRIQAPPAQDCFGAAANDNLHLCGEAAKELASRVCELISL